MLTRHLFFYEEEKIFLLKCEQEREREMNDKLWILKSNLDLTGVSLLRPMTMPRARED